MLAPRALVPLAAGLVTASALYFSAGVLDQVEVNGAVVRVAYLPGWRWPAGFAIAAALSVAALGRVVTARTIPGGRSPSLAETVMPQFALAVLALPYLPVLPDRWPALQALAGPLVPVVWLVVAGLQGWVIWQARVTAPAAPAGWPVRRLSAAILIATVVISGLTAMRLLATPAFPGGDEPHYLVISQSVWRDGDLDIHDNHQRGDYYEYTPTKLEPHYLRPGIDGGIYSIHPILMPVLMAPVYAAGGYAGVAAMLILIASIAATLAWRWARHVLDDTGAATFAWLAVVASTPFLLNSFTVYPETSAALAVMIAWVLTVTPPMDRPGVGRHLAIGVACATLPWFSTKYAPMSAALVLVAFGRLWQRDFTAFLREPRTWAVALPYGAALLGWFAFFYAYWGSPLPTAPYGDHGQTSPLTLLRGAPGLLFDQEYGLLAFAPVYVLAGTGLVSMWRAGRDLRRLAVELTLVFAALLGSVGAFALWWGGSASPARPLVSVLLLSVLPIGVAFQRAPRGSARRAAQHLLLWIGVGIAVTLTLAQNGLLIDNGRDGTAALLEYWSPRWGLWALTPTFTFHRAPLAYLYSLWWVVIAAGAGALLSRWRHLRPGAAALAALSVFSAALLTLVATMPLMPSGPLRPAIDLAARSRLVALDGFDAAARPVAVIYDPLRTVAAGETLTHLTLRVTPGLRTDRTPVRLIHNGRFSLPAGTYAIDVTFSADAPSIPVAFAVQVGRLGEPYQAWQPPPAPGAAWRARLVLPIDANFVGFRGTPETERAIDRIVITPTALVDALARPRVPAVLSAARYQSASVFFHDEQTHQERDGFWTRDRRSASITIAPDPGRTTPAVLRLNSGSQPNTASVTSSGWAWRGALVPGQSVEVALPAATRGVIPVTVAATHSFRPRDVDPASRDPRILGVRVDVKPD